MPDRVDRRTSRIAIGGIGGSGTRLLAEFVRDCGIYIGGDLNGPSDNLWFTLLFKRRSLLLATKDELRDVRDFFYRRMSFGYDSSMKSVESIVPDVAIGRVGHPADWLEARARTFEEYSEGANGARWGWKEPNTQIFAEYLLEQDTDLLYVHVVRNGFEMAFSSNQNQLEVWGPILLDRPTSPTPRDSLAYWCASHRRLEKIAERFPDRFLFIKFEEILNHPEATEQRLRSFADLPRNKTLHTVGFSRLIRKDSITERPPYEASEFLPYDIAYAEQWGYKMPDRI